MQALRKIPDSFPHPRRARGFSGRVFPVFLPFAGCGTRCIFCAQHIQTGTARKSVALTLEDAGRQLDLLEGEAPELAFYGGTFTALPPEDLALCLDFTRARLKSGRIRAARCSTRPDCLDAETLRARRDSGFYLLELGVQSFQDEALKRARRGYDRDGARRACAAVREAGFALGIQLMPGMPGLDVAGAARDVRLAAAEKPACARLYPCLVFAGTELAELWLRGLYRPPELTATVSFLAWAISRLQAAGIPVIRTGLAHTPELEKNVLAGPLHPALGNMARSLALFYRIRKQARRLAAKAPLELTVPRSLQGEFWGHKRALAGKYLEIGIGRKRVRWGDEGEFILRACEDESPLPIFSRSGSSAVFPPPGAGGSPCPPPGV
ncbi:MAG: radical SAM protein [Desulfovibrio sp.]|jgi:histone acetyltransferase (RNA polymerase elongator complex component)|nr:radical SAM protein [Desulfovibrio sp.]